MNHYCKTAVAVIAIISICFVGCTNQEDMQQEWQETESIIKNTELELNILPNMKSETVFILQNGNIKEGKRVWDEFLKKVHQQQPADIHIVYVPEAENEERETTTHSVILEYYINYNTQKYTIHQVRDGKIFTKTYKYLIERKGKVGNETAPIKYAYYLVNDESLTFVELEMGGLSSQIGEPVDFVRIVTEYLQDGNVIDK